MRALKPVPDFESEDAEREFWAKHDSTEFIDWQSAERRQLRSLEPVRSAQALSPMYRSRRRGREAIWWHSPVSVPECKKTR
jgi:hypothetical protein